MYLMYLSISGVSSKLRQPISIKPKVLEALGPHLCVDNILTSLAIERLYHAMNKMWGEHNLAILSVYSSSPSKLFNGLLWFTVWTGCDWGFTMSHVLLDYHSNTLTSDLTSLPSCWWGPSWGFPVWLHCLHRRPSSWHCTASWWCWQTLRTLGSWYETWSVYKTYTNSGLLNDAIMHCPGKSWYKLWRGKKGYRYIGNSPAAVSDEYDLYSHQVMERFQARS